MSNCDEFIFYNDLVKDSRSNKKRSNRSKKKVPAAETKKNVAIDEKDEGDTEFADGTRIQPVAGRLIFFPATWTFLHRGYPPKVKKYLCNGWIHSSP